MPDHVRPELVTDELGGAGDLLDLVHAGTPAWHADASCKEAPLDVSWFPAEGKRATRAKRICAGCLARSECLSWSLSQGPELDGIWAGLGRRDRAALRRRDKRAA